MPIYVQQSAAFFGHTGTGAVVIQHHGHKILSLNLNIDPVSGRAFKVIISHQDLEDGKVGAIANETEQETLQGLETDRT